MGKIFDVFKKAIFEEENNEKTQKATTQPTPEGTQSFHLSAGSAAVSPQVPEVGASKGEIDEEILDKLEEKLGQEDIPGPDYLELKEAAMDEESVANEPDERKRYRQAFANMKRFFPTAGVDKARILSAIDHYRKVMVAEGEDAKEDLKRKIQTEVTASKEKIAAEEEELNKRQELINLEREKLEQRKRAVVEREEALEKKSKNFLKTLEYLIGILDSDRKKLDEYLND